LTGLTPVSITMDITCQRTWRETWQHFTPNTEASNIF